MRSRLALLVAAAMALVLASFLVPLALLVRVVAADRAVTGATIEAQSLASLVATMDQASLRLVVDQLNATGSHRFTIFLPGGAVLGAPAAHTPAVRLAGTGRSFSVADPQGQEIVLAVQGLAGGTAVIRTVVGQAELRRGVYRSWLILTLLGVALLAFGVAVADGLARALVRPIGELARISRRLSAGDLGARAEPAGPPEVRKVAAALNHLAAHIRDLIRAERETVADLSHRLRTPLTALRLEVEASCGAAAAAPVMRHVDALEQAITELIQDTRQGDVGVAEVCDAAGVLAERVAFWRVLAEDQNRPLRTHLAGGPLPVRVPAADLAACLDALLANIFAHTPDGTAFAVTLAPRKGGGAVVSVDDAGPGFGGADPLRRGLSHAGSTGLGLDIARQTAQASGGGLRADRSEIMGGARVVVELGPAA